MGKVKKPAYLAGQEKCLNCEGLGQVDLVSGEPTADRRQPKCVLCGGFGFVITTSRYCGRCGCPYAPTEGRCPECGGTEFSLTPDALHDGWKKRKGNAEVDGVQKSAPPAPGERYEPAFPVKGIVRSLTNPRKTFDQAKLEELAASIREKGVLEPLLARPMGSGDVLELIAGERRLRAAKIAGVKTVPVRILPLDDVAALEVQVIENLQREDVDAVEEAEGFQQLIKVVGYTVDALAAKLGVSTSTVRASLKLLNLPPAAAEALSDGSIAISTAQLIGRIPSELLRLKATKSILEGRFHNGEPLNFREAKDHVEKFLMRELKGVPWDQADADLLPEAGACATCPKRTGNNRAEYPDARADICTDTDCFAAKMKSHGRIALQQAKAAGQPTLSAAEAKNTFTAQTASYGQLSYSSDYIDLESTCYEARNKKWSTVVLPEAKGEVVVGIDPHSGMLRQLILKRRADSLLKKKFPRPSPRTNPAPDPEWKKLREKEERERQLEKAVNQALGRAARDAAAAAPRLDGPLALMRTVARFVLESFGNEDDRHDELAKAVDTVGAAGCVGIICEALLGETPRYEPFVGLRAELIRALDIDAKAIAKQVKAEMAKSSKPKQKAKVKS